MLALQIALREMRGGLRGFYVLTACIALGVMAVAGVNSVASGLANGFAREGRSILGGDLAFLLSLREASTAEQDRINDIRARRSMSFMLFSYDSDFLRNAQTFGLSWITAPCHSERSEESGMLALDESWSVRESI